MARTNYTYILKLKLHFHTFKNKEMYNNRIQSERYGKRVIQSPTTYTDFILLSAKTEEIE